MRPTRSVPPCSGLRIGPAEGNEVARERREAVPDETLQMKAVVEDGRGTEDDRGDHEEGMQ